ncbi:DNA-directed RNA polymerase III subunit Rpc5 - like 1 [Theobroma cacao]|nr:DNA-directed RNA polymerase III subunit Rpc5 - like 1 [Theobroma cacao]
MDLDDLGELDGPSQVNTRTTKFAPKSSKFAPRLKPNFKPKPEPSSKQEPLNSGPKPEPPPPPPPESISRKKENEEEDIKPPVIAETKTEQSFSNGAVKMEIEEEAKEDVIMNEGNREEEDMVVREIDVFFTPSIDANTQLYVLQYPLRPCWRPYELDERCEEVRVKPASGEVEMDLAVDVDSNNYDSERASRLKMTKQTLSSSWLPPRTTGYAVGVLMGDKLHLNPIHAVVQLRPSMCHLKPSVSKRKNAAAADAEVTVKVEEPNDGKAAGSSTKQNKRMQSSTEQKADDKECWVPLKYHSSKNDFSAQYLQRMMAEESCPIQFTMSPYDYVDSLCPGASNNNKAQGPSRRYATLLVSVSSFHRLLLSIPLEERLKKLLSEGPPFHRFSALKHFAPDASIEDIFEVLQKHALLVQGLWVPKSSLLFPEDPYKSLARDYVLLLFSKNPIISLAQVHALSPSRKEEVKGFLKILAIERPSFKDWKLKENADEGFKKLYPDIVKNQEQIWRAGEDNVINHICRGAKGGPSRTKPGTVIKPGKAMNSDKGVRRVAPAVQAGRTMSDETREAIPKALKKVFQTHKVCSLQLIRKGLRDLALSQSTLPKADARMVVKAAYGADAPEHELQEVVSEVAVELHGGLFVLRSSPEHPEYDPLRLHKYVQLVFKWEEMFMVSMFFLQNPSFSSELFFPCREVVINLLRVKGKLKKADVSAAALLSLKREISNNEYNKALRNMDIA